ncbi:hypothetical protein D3C87_1821360 [compost metagenome]
MEVELADGHAVGPGSPLRADARGFAQTKQACAVRSGVGERLRAGRAYRPTCQGRRGDRGVIDDAVPDHLSDVRIDCDGIGGDAGELPGQLVFADQGLRGAIGPNVMQLHC